MLSPESTETYNCVYLICFPKITSFVSKPTMHFGQSWMSADMHLYMAGPSVNSSGRIPVTERLHLKEMLSPYAYHDRVIGDSDGGDEYVCGGDSLFCSTFLQTPPSPIQSQQSPRLLPPANITVFITQTITITTTISSRQWLISFVIPNYVVFVEEWRGLMPANIFCELTSINVITIKQRATRDTLIIFYLLLCVNF